MKRRRFTSGCPGGSGITVPQKRTVDAVVSEFSIPNTRLLIALRSGQVYAADPEVKLEIRVARGIISYTPGPAIVLAGTPF